MENCFFFGVWFSIIKLGIAVLHTKRRENTVATSTFKRKIEITDPESVLKLIEVMGEDTPAKALADQPYTQEKRERSALLLKQCLSRTKI